MMIQYDEYPNWWLTLGTFAMRIQEDQHLSLGSHSAFQTSSYQSFTLIGSQETDVFHRFDVIVELLLQMF